MIMIVLKFLKGMFMSSPQPESPSIFPSISFQSLPATPLCRIFPARICGNRRPVRERGRQGAHHHDARRTGQ